MKMKWKDFSGILAAKLLIASIDGDKTSEDTVIEMLADAYKNGLTEELTQQAIEVNQWFESLGESRLHRYGVQPIKLMDEHVAFYLKDGTPIYHYYDDGINNEPELFAYSWQSPDVSLYHCDGVFDVRHLMNWREYDKTYLEGFDLGVFMSHVNAIVQEAADNNLIERWNDNDANS